MSPTSASDAVPSTLKSLEERIDNAASSSDQEPSPDARLAVEELLQLLERGELRAAECDSSDNWPAVPWVKRGILLGFRVGELIDMSPETIPDSQSAAFSFFDKDTFPLRELTLGDSVRLVPGGSSIRRGTYIAPGVVCMPPMYINVGAARSAV